MRILRRLEASGGQGLLGFVAVIGLFSATLAVGLLGYIGFQDRKADKQAQANLLSAVQMALVYRANHGSYAGMDTVDLRKIDPRLSTTLTVACGTARQVLPRGQRAREGLEHRWLRPI